MIGKYPNQTSQIVNQPAPLQTEQQGAFEPGACMFQLPAGVNDGDEIRCGYLTVPENHAAPDGRTIRLAVAIIKARSPNPHPDPLIMAQGGPGGSTIEAYAETLLTKKTFVPDQDIVLFDQRGTKYSTPNLYCTEVDQLIADTVEQQLSDAEEEQLGLEAMQACKNRLTGQGFNLSAFDSLENAEDIETLRLALGYPQINLYGVSYGALLAQHYMQLYPHSLRSVILDGVVPRQTNFILNSARTMDQSFTRLFEACKAAPDCDRRYPDLENVFFELVDDLNRNPAHLPLTDRETNITYPNAIIDGDVFMSGVFQMLYIGSIIPALPQMIYDVKQGNFEFFKRIYSMLLFDRSVSIGMYYSVVCAEEANFSVQDQDLNGVRPQIAKSEAQEPKSILDTCKVWEVERLPASADLPVRSDTPTLLLSGGFDPITPASYADTVAQTLSRHYSFVFPAGGHGQALEGNCQNGIIQAFLNNPSQKPEASCISGIGALVFYTPANTVEIPALIKILNIEGNTGVEALALFLASLFLFSAIFGIPVIGLISRSKRQKRARQSPSTAQPYDDLLDSEIYSPIQTIPGEPHETPQAFFSPRRSTFLSQSAGWVAFFAGPLLAGFLMILTIIVFKMALNNDNQILFGVPSSDRMLFILPVVFFLLSLWMFAASLTAWIQKYWSIWTRLYYTGLTAAALVCLVVLAIWGLLTPLF